MRDIVDDEQRKDRPANPSARRVACVATSDASRRSSTMAPHRRRRAGSHLTASAQTKDHLFRTHYTSSYTQGKKNGAGLSGPFFLRCDDTKVSTTKEFASC